MYSVTAYRQISTTLTWRYALNYKVVVITLTEGIFQILSSTENIDTSLHVYHCLADCIVGMQLRSLIHSTKTRPNILCTPLTHSERTAALLNILHHGTPLTNPDGAATVYGQHIQGHKSIQMECQAQLEKMGTPSRFLPVICAKKIEWTHIMHSMDLIILYPSWNPMIRIGMTLWQDTTVFCTCCTNSGVFRDQQILVPPETPRSFSRVMLRCWNMLASGVHSSAKKNMKNSTTLQ